MKLVKVQGHEYVMETNPSGENIPFKAAPILRKAPFNIEELEKKNRELEIKKAVKLSQMPEGDLFCDN